MRLDFFEGCPEKSEFRRFPFGMAAMDIYAELIGATELRITNPINNEIKEYYESFDFKFIANGNYFTKSAIRQLL